MPESRQRSRLDPVFRIKITLLQVRPTVWRRILVPPDLTLAQLGKYIEAAMGWGGRHLHDFRVGKEIYGEPDEDDDPYLLTRRRDDSQYKVSQLFHEPKAAVMYTYDFGDQWEHELKLESWDAREPQIEYPICIGGARACPPDDCGGPPGYAELVKTIKNPRHPEHESMLAWLGGGFDPDAFSMDEATHRMEKCMRRRKRAVKRS
jgi:hypothetical protein